MKQSDPLPFHKGSGTAPAPSGPADQDPPTDTTTATAASNLPTSIPGAQGRGSTLMSTPEAPPASDPTTPLLAAQEGGEQPSSNQAVGQGEGLGAGKEQQQQGGGTEKEGEQQEPMGLGPGEKEWGWGCSLTLLPAWTSLTCLTGPRTGLFCPLHATSQLITHAPNPSCVWPAAGPHPGIVIGPAGTPGGPCMGAAPTADDISASIHAFSPVEVPGGGLPSLAAPAPAPSPRRVPSGTLLCSRDPPDREGLFGGILGEGGSSEAAFLLGGHDVGDLPPVVDHAEVPTILQPHFTVSMSGALDVDPCLGAAIYGAHGFDEMPGPALPYSPSRAHPSSAPSARASQAAAAAAAGEPAGPAAATASSTNPMSPTPEAVSAPPGDQSQGRDHGRFGGDSGSSGSGSGEGGSSGGGSGFAQGLGSLLAQRLQAPFSARCLLSRGLVMWEGCAASAFHPRCF